MFFNGWFGPLRVLLVGALAYLGLILWLRFSGKRTLSKWNAFDFVVTVALGSTLATIILSKETALVEGLTAFAVLIALQFAITWLSTRFRSIERVVKAEPTLLLRDGKFIQDSMRKERVTESEIRAAVRAAGFASLDHVNAVVLETDGSFSVIRDVGNPSTSALSDVKGFDQ